ncbi:MAG TPA: putative motility protein [Massilibacterium sp.]|nr:putative motility protein [Massilibacterium sp.]
MDLTAAMNFNLQSLQQTVQLSMLNKSFANQTTAATMMLQDFTQTQPTNVAPHPTLGKSLDIRI